MSEPALPPVNVKTIARVALALVALVSAGILILTFGPLRDRTPDTPVAGAGEPPQSPPAGPVAKGPAGDAAGATAIPGNTVAPGNAVSPGNTAAAPGDAVGEGAPSFDVVRVEPNGEAVIGGRARPDAAIELLMTEAGGAAAASEPRVLQRAVTDASGLFAMTNGPLPAGAHVLSLRVRAPDGSWTPSRQTVSVTIQPPKPPLVALLAPDKAATLISSPEQGQGAGQGSGQAQGQAATGAPGEGMASGDGAGKPASPDAAAGNARISQVETDDDGRLFVVGSARPGANVRLYLNDALLASGVASASGAIEFALQSPLPAGDYRVRLDMVDPATGKVLSRAEAPWENARATSAGGAAGAQAKDGQGASTGKKPSRDAIQAVPVRTHVVARGDTLWSISRRTYQLGSRYTTIYDANQDQIADANRIYPGQVFVLPGKSPPAPLHDGDAPLRGRAPGLDGASGHGGGSGHGGAAGDGK